MKNDNKKIIAFFTVSMGRGGAERVISRLLPHISVDYDVVLFLLDSSKVEYDVNVPIVSLGGEEPRNRIKYIYYLCKASLRFKKYVQKNNISCVISFLSTPNIINIFFNNKKVKKVISIRGQLEVKGTFLTKIKQQVEKVIYKKADNIIVPSMQLKDDIVKACKVNRSLIKVIYNPIDVKEVTNLSTEKIDSKYETIFKNNKTIIALGRLTYEKGYDHLLRVFAKVARKTEDVKLIIIGDGKLKNQLMTLAKELDLEERVIFTGQIRNPFPYLKMADLFVMSSVSEGFPNALVEAMACGTPVISTDCKSGPREILCKNFDLKERIDKMEQVDYGILVPEFIDGDNGFAYLQMSKSIIGLLCDKEMKEKYSFLSRKGVERFSIEKCVNKYIEIIG